MNTENTTMTNDCKTCPVSTGTHKPAEAVHQIDEPQADALLELAAYRFTVTNREARIAELEKENSYLNNACAELEAQLEAIGAGGVEPLRKPAAAPQEEAIAEIVSASHDQAEFGERAINFLRDFQHLEYGTKLYPAPQAVQAATQPAAQGMDAIRALIAQHGKELERNHYAYFELAYTRRTGWMVWITDKPAFRESVLVNPDRKVLARGQGDTPEAACADALAAQAKQGEQKT